MKVACIGNMNNMLFSLVRFLRDRGVEADLLLEANEYPHFHPSHDSFDLSYQAYTRRLDWLTIAAYAAISPGRLHADLDRYDFLIVCGVALPFLERIGRRADVFFPHGSDLYYWPFYGAKMKWHQRVRNRPYYQFYEAQGRGIREARVVNQEDGNALYRNALLKLGALDHTYYFGCPMVYTGIYAPDCIGSHYGRSAWYREFKQIRDSADLLVVSQARHEWFSADPMYAKGNDRLIRGFAKYLRDSGDRRACLALFEYGNDVEKSKQLATNLGISSFIAWLPLMARKEIMVLLSMADITCGEFYAGCIGGGTTWEGLASGKPLLHYYRADELDFGAFSGVYPAIEAGDEYAIAEALLQWRREPERFRQLGAEGARWYAENFESRSMRSWLDAIAAQAAGRDIRDVFAGRRTSQQASGPNVGSSSCDSGSTRTERQLCAL
jgi:glycosyltransferase involved in cell wall biosynthesis